MLSSPDIMPTLLGLAGLADSIPAEVQGRNYAPLFFDEKADIVRPTGALYIQNLDGEKDAEGMVCSISLHRAALNRRAIRWRSTLTAKIINWSKVCCLTMKGRIR